MHEYRHIILPPPLAPTPTLLYSWDLLPTHLPTFIPSCWDLPPPIPTFLSSFWDPPAPHIPTFLPSCWDQPPTHPSLCFLDIRTINQSLLCNRLLCLSPPLGFNFIYTRLQYTHYLYIQVGDIQSYECRISFCHSSYAFPACVEFCNIQNTVCPTFHAWY